MVHAALLLCREPAGIHRSAYASLSMIENTQSVTEGAAKTLVDFIILDQTECPEH